MVWELQNVIKEVRDFSVQDEAASGQFKKKKSLDGFRNNYWCPVPLTSALCFSRNSLCWQNKDSNVVFWLVQEMN